MEYIDNVYVINMDRSYERLANMERQIPVLGKSFQRINAIDGKRLSQEDIQNAVNKTYGMFCPPNIIGCFLSHRKAWQQMLDNNDKYALILEDDCELIPNFQEQLKYALDDIFAADPNWEFLYASCFGPCNDIRPDSMFTSLQRYFLPKVAKKPFQSEYTYVPISPVGFHCYIISDKCASKLLKYLNKVITHVDVQFLTKSKHFNVYATKTKLGVQYSTTENSTLNDCKFPKLLNKVLDNVKDKDEISYSYYFGSPLIQIYFLPVNLYFLIFLMIAFLTFTLRRNKYINFGSKIILVYLVLEMTLDPTNISVILVYVLLLSFTLRQV
jgi:GR25 family glycosyltransferase involved in LPS biosynthesis